jgi:signal transduction histidine kinase
MSLARDLHDGIVQFLAGSTYRIEAISRAAGDRRDVAASLQDLKELMLLEQEDLRTSIAALRTDTVDLAQVTKEARSLCDRLGRHWQIDCSFAADVPDRIVSSRLHLDVLQIIREAVANAVRHSSTKKVDVRVDSADELLMLKIQNDGVATKDEPTSGPWSIRERVQESGGTMSMTSGQRGTELSVQFPIFRSRP